MRLRVEQIRILGAVSPQTRLPQRQVQTGQAKSSTQQMGSLLAVKRNDLAYSQQQGIS